jgi:serine O-acetyltransferase
MTFRELRYYLQSDLYRIDGRVRLKGFLWHIIFGEGYKYNFWMRATRFCSERPVLRLTLFPLCRVILRHYRVRFGISVPYRAQVGAGFYIGHYGGIFVSYQTIIGKNRNISQGVTIGKGNRGKNKSHPIVGDTVYIGPGAKIIGAVKIGNNVAIGANCVVTQDVPNNAVVVGVPGRVISYAGAAGYVEKVDYDAVLGGGRLTQLPARGGPGAIKGGGR